jgi:hypothetical protein
LGGVQVPQLTSPPHPSETSPHAVWPPVATHRAAAVAALQQTLGVSPCEEMPPQVSAAVQADPHVNVVPQLFVSVPQFAGEGHWVKFGGQPHW